MGVGSSRFITYGLGKGDPVALKNIFATTFTIHVILAILIVAVAETAGLWFFHNKMVISPDRLYAAEWVFHLSILTAFFSLTQVPFNACIIAHEKLTVFAYVSMAESLCNLLIVYVLLIGQTDKLILYAVLHFILQISVLCFYRIYGTRHFPEVRIRLRIDKDISREIMGFSGWSLFASSSIALNSNGILILLNMFFPSAVVAARSISVQVNMAATQFMTNFQTAALPQIVKSYAAKDYNGSRHLLLETAKFSYFLMLLLSIPIYFSAEELLTLWLGEVPPYTVVFLQLISIQSLFQVFDTTFYYALYAKGQLRENALISPTTGFISFPIVYLLFKAGFPPVTLSWASIIMYAMLGVVIKPILIIRLVNYKWHDVLSVFIPCLKVTLASLPLPLLTDYSLKNGQLPLWQRFTVIVAGCMISVVVSCWYLGLSPEMRIKLVAVARKAGSKFISRNHDMT